MKFLWPFLRKKVFFYLIFRLTKSHFLRPTNQTGINGFKNDLYFLCKNLNVKIRSCVVFRYILKIIMLLARFNFSESHIKFGVSVAKRLKLFCCINMKTCLAGWQ